MNDRIKKFSTQNNIDLVNNSNINETCLSKSKLHMNKKGNSYLANNFIDYMKNWDAACPTKGSEYDESIKAAQSEIKNLRVK